MRKALVSPASDRALRWETRLCWCDWCVGGLGVRARTVDAGRLAALNVAGRRHGQCHAYGVDVAGLVVSPTRGEHDRDGQDGRHEQGDEGERGATPKPRCKADPQPLDRRPDPPSAADKGGARGERSRPAFPASS